MRVVRRIVKMLVLAAVSACLPVSVFAQFSYSVYDGSWNSLPDFTSLTPIDTGTSNAIDVSVTSQVETFGLVFSAQITVDTAATYDFQTHSDDGSKLYIDAVTVVDNDGLHAPQTQHGSIFLAVGTYNLRVEFFEKGGGEILEVLYRVQGGDYASIPAHGLLDGYVPGKHEIGDWGAVINWPEIAISAANLPDGRVLTWSSTETNAFPSSTEFTHASVFDPLTSSFTTVDSNFHDMFCAGIATLEDGRIVASGGNPDDDRVSAFDPNTLSWSALPTMADRRWYATSVALPDNNIWSTFGKSAGNRSERYDADENVWIATPQGDMQTLLNEQNTINAASNPTGALNLEWWAHMAMTPFGDVFQGGPAPSWHRFDPLSGSATESLGQPAGTRARMYGNAVTYDVGKVMLVGGADRRENPATTNANVYLVDLNGPAPVVEVGPALHHARALSNTVTLPNGEVLVIGGNTSGKIFSDEGTVYAAEIYNPISNSWSLAASMDIPRNYHSTALLLKDGRVLSAGGGACGGCAANHLDGQIYSPPYLFDTAGNAAVRPTLSGVPAQLSAGQQITVTASADAASFSMVRLSGTTHHMNTDQRFVPVSSIDNLDGTFTLTLHANPNVLIMGNYWLYAVNANGTPSLGETVQVLRQGDVAPGLPAGGVYLSDMPWALESNGWGPAERDTNNGETPMGDGSTQRLNGMSYAKGVGAHAYSEITVDIAAGYDRFLADIGLDDSRDGLCGSVQFEVDVDGSNVLSSGPFFDVTATQSLAIDVGGAANLTLKVNNNGDGDCGDHANWANARLLVDDPQGFRYFRFTPTKLRDDASAASVHLSELALYHQGVRLSGAAITNPSGISPAGDEPFNANDSDVSTRWQDFNKGALIYDFTVNVMIDAYSLATANDAPERDPVRWLLEGSSDGNSWTIIDDQSGSDVAVPLARYTYLNSLSVDLTLDSVTPLPAIPHNSTTLVVESSQGLDRVWNVNPDNASVSVSDSTGTLLQEIDVGDRPWSLAKAPGANRIYVANKGSATVSVIDTATLGVVDTVALPAASQPHGLIFSTDGNHYFVVLEALAQVQKRNSADDSLANSLQLSGKPRHLASTFDGSKLYVSNFITPRIPGEETLTLNTAAASAEIFVVDPLAMTLITTSTLPYDSRPLSESQGPGMPNYLNAPIISFNDQFAYIPSKKDNVDSGLLRAKPGMTFDSTVRANTSRLVLASSSEDSGFRVDHDNSSVATGAALSGENRYLFVALETSRELAVYDTQSGFELMRLSTGRAPQGVALSSDGSRVYVHNFMDRSLSRFDVTSMLQTHLPSATALPSVDVVASEALAPSLLNGKQLFYDAQDDRLAHDNYMSCAACHNDGGQDGRIWDISSMGEGLRNTIDLRSRGVGHGILHWSGNFDEVQDFENQIRSLSLGTGLMTQADFDSTVATLGPPKAGLSVDLDALAAYVNSLTLLSESPHRPTPSTLSTAAQNGQLNFVSQGCIACHSGAVMTDSSSMVLHDVGTLTVATGNRLGAAVTGLDTQSVLGAWQSPPYLHDGSAATLELAIQSHVMASALPQPLVDDLAQFIREAGSAEAASMIDTDGDGSYDFIDPAITNACVPTVFVAACGQDSDADGESDFSEGEFVDSDGDGVLDYMESSIVDSDGDTIVDQDDAGNDDVCVPFVQLCEENVPIPPLFLIILALGLSVVTMSRRMRV